MSPDAPGPDPAATVRRVFDCGNRRAYGELEALFDAGALLDLTRQGLGTYEGPAAIRAFCEGWIEVYDHFVLTAAELVDLGAGVVLTRNRHEGRLRGSSAEVVLDNAWVFACREGRIVLWTAYDAEQDARAAAHVLVESGG